MALGTTMMQAAVMVRRGQPPQLRPRPAPHGRLVSVSGYTDNALSNSQQAAALGEVPATRLP